MCQGTLRGVKIIQALGCIAVDNSNNMVNVYVSMYDIIGEYMMCSYKRANDHIYVLYDR